MCDTIPAGVVSSVFFVQGLFLDLRAVRCVFYALVKLTCCTFGNLSWHPKAIPFLLVHQPQSHQPVQEFPSRYREKRIAILTLVSVNLMQFDFRKTFDMYQI